MTPDEYVDAFEFNQDPAAEVDEITTEHDAQFYFDGMEEHDQPLQLQRYLYESDLNEIEAPSTKAWIDTDPTTVESLHDDTFFEFERSRNTDRNHNVMNGSPCIFDEDDEKIKTK